MEHKLNRFGKFFTVLLLAIVVYAIIVGTLVSPTERLPEDFGFADVVKLLPSGFLVALSGILAVYMDQASFGKRRFFLLWAFATFLTLGFGMAWWVIASAAMSSFMILGFIPILVFSFMIKYDWNT